jgi:flagellar biosynthetic protein FlhB
MSENSTPEERTEMPTDKRWHKIRSEGMLPMSQELNQVVVLMVAFLLLSTVASWIWSASCLLMKRTFLKIASRPEVNPTTLKIFIYDALMAYLPSIGLLMVVTAFTAITVTFVQTRGNVREKIIRFRWDFLNPVGGLKRIFSYRGLVTVLKAIFKLALLLPVGFYTLWSMRFELLSLIARDYDAMLSVMASGVDRLFWNLLYVLIPLAIFDYIYSRYTFFRENKMTKEEVKDERKSMEGDESTKRKIRAKGLERAWQRLAVAVPKADVVIINPTHYAVALRYDRSTMVAPQVVAKGKGHLAIRIREIARQAGVPMVQRRMLVRSLYYGVKIGATIPFELFRAVAEVLAYVYRIRPPKRDQQAGATPKLT